MKREKPKMRIYLSHTPNCWASWCLEACDDSLCTFFHRLFDNKACAIVKARALRKQFLAAGYTVIKHY